MGTELQHSHEWPPPLPDETAVERSSRLEKEARAKQISDEIDAAIEVERLKREQKRHQKKVLLLGQTHSGKSTLLKSFQLQYAPIAFRAEVEAWRAVIYLNLVHSINVILDIIESGRCQVSREVKHLKIRLSPLRQVLSALSSCLATDVTLRRSMSDDIDIRNSRRVSRVSFHTPAWKSLGKVSEPGQIGQDELDSARNIIIACGADMVALCGNNDVHKYLQDQKVSLDSQLIYFLKEAGRIADAAYLPSNDDILRARLETIGIEEHCVAFESVDRGQEWIWYDIEGFRSSRAAWVPYFDDVNTVMFLCSMANFDQPPEGSEIDAFSDCLRLWKTVCENKLLANTVFVLFLNKSDLLDVKLKSGVFFGEFVKDFGHRGNDLQSVSQYYKEKFFAVHKASSPKPRLLHVQTICAIDTPGMANIFEDVRQAILSASVANLRAI